MKYHITIHVPNGSGSPIISFACKELDRYLSRIFPQSVLEQISCTLALTDSASAPDFAPGMTDSLLRYDGYSVSGPPKDMRICSPCERGLLHGVYALLVHLGCSFLFPGGAREFVPRLEKWPFAQDISIKNVPWLEYRGLCFYNTTRETLSKTLDAIDWMCKNGFNFLLTSIHRLSDTDCGGHGILWDEIGDELLPEIQKRGIVLDMSEHSTDYYFPRKELFTKHPEWFAQVNGVRSPGQICYSNPDAVAAYADALAGFAADKPWFEFMGIWPLDGGGYCECEKCRNPQTIFRANAFIAKKLKKVRPDLTVEHLAYTPQSFPRPESEMPDNMSVLVCAVRDRIAYEWAIASRRAKGAFYFDYMTGDHYRYRSDVILNPRHCRETVNALASYGFRGVVSLYLPVDCWFQSSLNYRYLSRLYYDPAADMGQLHKQLAAELFGAELADMGAKLLSDISEKLFDCTLWSGFAHGHEWFCEHITDRSPELEQAHAAQFDRIFSLIMEKLRPIGQNAQERYQKNIQNMEAFLELQKLYYHCVDQYDARRDTPKKAEPYFEKLRELEKTEDSPFIPEAYARWRITGRDNIFEPMNVNPYQPAV